MRRLLALVLACLLLCSGALAEGFSFQLSVSIDPMHVDASQKQMAHALQPLLKMLDIKGDVALGENAFDVTVQASLNDAPESPWSLRLYGLDSHWGVQSNWLGDTTLMVNQLAWLEFAVKTYHHLGLPIQKAFLCVSPYAHMSAWEGIQTALVTLRQTEQDGLISQEHLRICAEEIARLADEDRALYYYIEAIGLESGTNEEIRATLRALPQMVAEQFPDGLQVEHTEQGETWRNGNQIIYTCQTTEASTQVTVAVPTLGTISWVVNTDTVASAGTVTLDTAWLTAHAQFSLPTSWPVRFPFFVQLDAQGALVGEKVQYALLGEAQGNALTLSFLSQEEQFMTVKADITPEASQTAPAYTSEEIEGVNILSVDGPALSALMREIALPLYQGALPWLVHAPAQTIQTLMDALEEDGVFQLLIDSLLGAEAEEY